jgi:hypothetical protein
MPEALVTQRKPAIGFGLLGVLVGSLAISAASVYIHATYSHDRISFAQHGMGSAALLRIEVDCSGPGGIETPPTRGKIDLGWISREGLVTIQAQLGGESPRFAYRLFVNGRVAVHYGDENNLNNTAGLGGGKSTGEIVYVRGYSATGQDRGEIGCGPPNVPSLPAAVEKAAWIRPGSAEAELFSFVSTAASTLYWLYFASGVVGFFWIGVRGALLGREKGSEVQLVLGIAGALLAAACTLVPVLGLGWGHTLVVTLAMVASAAVGMVLSRHAVMAGLGSLDQILRHLTSRPSEAPSPPPRTSPRVRAQTPRRKHRRGAGR